MQRVIKVKFRNTSRSYYFDALDFEIHKGDGLIVDTMRGNMLGEATGEPEEMEDEKLTAPLKPVIRLATQEDRDQMEYYRAKEPDAMSTCQKKIDEHGLEMKLVDAEYAFNGSKLTFYFTADSRVDFRELLKDLTPIFKTRIDLRQIGDRDEAKKCGGLGFCGRPICCNSFLTEFTPVSIKMAKTQNLSLNPLKISGICGKLMCCLRYEQDCYESMQKIMPKVGREFITPDGPGVVIENNVVTETTKLKVTLSDGTFDIRSYPFRELLGCGENCSCADCNGECCSAQRSANEAQIEQVESAKPEPDGEKSEDEAAPAQAVTQAQAQENAETAEAEPSGEAEKKSEPDSKKPKQQNARGAAPRPPRFKNNNNHTHRYGRSAQQRKQGYNKPAYNKPRNNPNSKPAEKQDQAPAEKPAQQND